jgi:hypothetical protein
MSLPMPHGGQITAGTMSQPIRFLFLVTASLSLDRLSA